MSVKKIKRKIVYNMPSHVFDIYTNCISKIKRYPYRITSSNDGNVINIYDGKDHINICRRARISVYKRGIEARIKKLNSSYLLDHITDPISGVFVDCGANVGELGTFSRAKGLEYHAFEPEALEADCCDLNNFGGAPITNRVGLWLDDGELSFYSKPSSADSSLFETEDYIECYTIKVRSLDSYISEKNITRIAVIKIEAEGAEPEVLLGSKNSLLISKYVTVDCGFERGKLQESTLIPVINIIKDLGFEAIAWDSKRFSVLFKNKLNKP